MLVLSFLAHSGQTAESPPNEAKIAEEQRKIQRLQRHIETQKSKVQATTKKEGSILSELERLNGNIRNEGAKLNRLKKDMAENERLMATRENEAAQAKTAKDQAQAHIKKRLHAFYRMGDLGALNVIFSSRELPDLLAFREYFTTLRAHDLAAVREYRERVADLERNRIELQLQQQALAENIGKVQEQEKMLAESRAERVRLLDNVKTEKKLYQAALGELEGAADRLTRTIEKLKKDAEQSRREEAEARKGRTVSAKQPPPAGSGFASQKGRLNPPAPGTVTSAFGKNSQNKFGIATFASGIDIKTAPGAKITAVHGGRIIYAKFLRGYGNLLIIDHGDQYLSLVSRAEKFFKEEGDTVGKGEVIGVMSEQEDLAGEGLHFEIRKGSKPEDPLLWLNKRRLTTKPAARKSR